MILWAVFGMIFCANPVQSYSTVQRLCKLQVWPGIVQRLCKQSACHFCQCISGRHADNTGRAGYEGDCHGETEYVTTPPFLNMSDGAHLPPVLPESTLNPAREG